jgi:hypothetical protein
MPGSISWAIHDGLAAPGSTVVRTRPTLSTAAHSDAVQETPRSGLKPSTGCAPKAPALAAGVVVLITRPLLFVTAQSEATQETAVKYSRAGVLCGDHVAS